jgi:hypothetical protein
LAKLTRLTARYDMRITATLRRLNSGALNFWVALLANAHQVGLGGTPTPHTLPPSLKNLNEATNCVTPKRVSGLGVLFVATRVGIIGRVPARSQRKARLRNALDQATLFEVVRCAMTLPLPHFRQRNRLTNWATGAPGLIPKRTRFPSAMMPRC